jgi:hypothetical protein
MTIGGSSRAAAVWALVVTACVAGVLALVVGYVQHAAVNSDQFANRATAALRDSSVRSLVAERVTDEVVLKNKSDLIAARPLIQTIVSTLIGGRAFTGAFRAGVHDVHSAIFRHDKHTLTLTLSDVGTIVAAALEVVRPALAPQVRATGRVDLLQRDISSAGASAARAAHTVRLLAWLFSLLALAAAAGAIALADDRRRVVVRLGVGIAAGAVLMLFTLAIARTIAVDHVHGADARDAAKAVWDAFLGDLATAAWIMGIGGAVVAAAADSLIKPVDVDAHLRRAAGWLTHHPQSPRLRVARGIVLVAIGLTLILARDAVLRVAFTAVGLYLVYIGVSAVLWVVYQPREARRAPAPEGPHRTQRGRVLVGGAVAAAAIIAAAGVFLGSGGTSTAAPAYNRCEGSEGLCDRSLEQIAIPATHNAMAAPLPGWFASEQDHPIAQQLRDGVRGLLIDTHYADQLRDGRLRTEFGDASKLHAIANQDGVSPSALDAALRIRDRLGFAGKGTRGMYLCHTLCEIGGTPLASVLTDIHDFLIANPGEVVVVVNQDYVTPADFVAAVDRAGLGAMAYRGPTARGRWPTLREMIDSNQRVVFLAENHAGAAPWYHLAYDGITKETPYTFTRTAQLTDPSRIAASCRPNRGTEGAPLFLVNHWISTDPIPLPSHARTVNAYAPLLARLRECERIRHQVPNLVAVNFYRQGDVMRAIDALNAAQPSG